MKPQIDRWMEEDRKIRFKQRHTAKRIHDRLQEEYPEKYDCSYELVQRYCKQKKEQTSEKAGALELVWYPGLLRRWHRLNWSLHHRFRNQKLIQINWKL